MQTITPLTAIGSSEPIFQILYTDIPSSELTRQRSFRDYEALHKPYYLCTKDMSS